MGAESRIARLAAGVVFLAAAPVVAREISVRRKDHKLRRLRRIEKEESKELARESCVGDYGIIFTEETLQFT